MLLTCPSCSRQLNVPDEAAGKAVRCPLCQNVFQIPAATPPAPHVAQAVAPAPLAPPPAPPPPDPGRGYELDLAGPDEYGPGPRAERAARRGAVLLLLSAIVFATATVLSALLEVVTATMISQQVPLGRSLVGTVLASQLFLLVVLVATPVVFQFVGSFQLRRLRGYGLVVTGIVLDFVLSGILILIGVIRIVQLGQIRYLNLTNSGTVTLLTVVSALLLLACAAFGIVAGCLALGALNGPAVRSAYAARAPRRFPRRDYYPEDYRGGPPYERR